MSAKPLLKAILACVCIAAIVEVAGADLFPEVSFFARLVYAGCVILFIVVLAAVAVVAAQQWNLFSLNQGGTDPQWMWFGEEPPGLKMEREHGAAAIGASTVDGARSGDA